MFRQLQCELLQTMLKSIHNLRELLGSTSVRKRLRDNIVFGGCLVGVFLGARLVSHNQSKWYPNYWEFVGQHYDQFYVVFHPGSLLLCYLWWVAMSHVEGYAVLSNRRRRMAFMYYVPALIYVFMLFSVLKPPVATG